MADQLDMFSADAALAEEARPLARSSDPVTSKLAARELVKTGELGRQHRLVLEALKKRPGMTSDELAANAQINRYTCARRLPELAASGLARRGARRVSTLSGRSAVTWFAEGWNEEVAR